MCMEYIQAEVSFPSATCARGEPAELAETGMNILLGEIFDLILLAAWGSSRHLDRRTYHDCLTL